MSVDLREFVLAGDTEPEAMLGLAGRYSQLKGDCEKCVSSWRQASNQMYDPRPFHHLLSEGKPGVWLSNKPRRGVVFEYGIGSDRKYHIERNHQGAAVRERFFFHSETRVVSFQFSSDFGELQWVDVLWLADGCAIKYRRHSPLRQIGSLVEVFHYDQRRRVERAECTDIRFGVKHQWTFLFHWDEGDSPISITSLVGETTSTIFRAPSQRYLEQG